MIVVGSLAVAIIIVVVALTVTIFIVFITVFTAAIITFYSVNVNLVTILFNVDGRAILSLVTKGVLNFGKDLRVVTLLSSFQDYSGININLVSVLTAVAFFKGQLGVARSAF